MDTTEETDVHQQEENIRAKAAADELGRRALRNDFDQLCIVAPPKTLGVLRKALTKQVEQRLASTINQEMSGRPIPTLKP